MSNAFSLRPELLYDNVDGSGDDAQHINTELFNSISNNGEDSACLRAGRANITNPGDAPCFSSWSWDATKCTDMMPFKVQQKQISGAFTQVSSFAMARQIVIGSPYTLSFDNNCNYVLKVGNLSKSHTIYTEFGSFNWTRASRTSATDGVGGNNMYATLELANQQATTVGGEPDTWGSVWTARLRFEGSFQSRLGIATFKIE